VFRALLLIRLPIAPCNLLEWQWIWNGSAPIQLAQCRFLTWLAISNAKISKYIFQIKHTEAMLTALGHSSLFACPVMFSV